MNNWHSLDVEDDLLHMEQSCFRTFIGAAQRPVLLELWDRGEPGDDAEFVRKFAPEELLRLTKSGDGGTIELRKGED